MFVRVCERRGYKPRGECEEDRARARQFNGPGVARSVRLALVAALGWTLAGCATAIPLPSFVGVAQNDVTGSIGQVSPLSSELDAEDWRRARAALAVALDPQGNGAAVAWDNPQSGMTGSFVPVGQAWAADDNICRAFLAKLGGAHPSRELQGSACRGKDGRWQVGKVEPWRPGPAASVAAR